MPNGKISVKLKLLQQMRKLCEDNSDITLVSLCTTDGFPIKHIATNELGEQADKLAAISSTLSALSCSSAIQMQKGQCEITIIEATSGNMLFVKTDYLETQCVLTVIADIKMSLAEARYKTKKLSQEIAKIVE